MKKYLDTILVLAVMFVGSGIGFTSVFGYGSGSGNETITLTTPNSWVVVSPLTKLSKFNYIEDDISSILTYDASAGAFVVPSSSDLLEPVNAFYMLPNKETGVSFDWGDFIPGFSSKELSAGWNLIGTNTSGGAVDELSTIQDSAFTVHVPGTFNERKSLTGSSWGDNANRDIDKTNWNSSDLFNPRDGYWVYITNSVNYEKQLIEYVPAE